MKKVTITLIILFSLVFFGLIGIYFLGLTSIKENIKSEFGLIKGEEKEFTQAFKEYEIFPCKPGLLKVEYVFVSHRDYSYRNEDRKLLKTTFYNTARRNILSTKWNIEYTGGTTIKNTTFPELVKMVKEDCSQFQESYYDLTGYENYEELSYDEQTKLWPEIEKNNLNWIYTPAPTQEEVEEQNRAAIDWLRGSVSEISPEGQKVFKEIYGDIDQMTDEEVLALAEKIRTEKIDQRVYITDMTASFHQAYSKLTDQQKQIILNTYGPWENLSDKELADYYVKIREDVGYGKLVLE